MWRRREWNVVSTAPGSIRSSSHPYYSSPPSTVSRSHCLSRSSSSLFLLLDGASTSIDETGIRRVSVICGTWSAVRPFLVSSDIRTLFYSFPLLLSLLLALSPSLVLSFLLHRRGHSHRSQPRTSRPSSQCPSSPTRVPLDRRT